jgi:hypothetical protein
MSRRRFIVRALAFLGALFVPRSRAAEPAKPSNPPLEAFMHRSSDDGWLEKWHSTDGGKTWHYLCTLGVRCR